MGRPDGWARGRFPSLLASLAVPVTASFERTSGPSGPRIRLFATAQVVTAGGCWALAAVIAKIGFEHGIAPVRMAEARVLVALIVLAVALGGTRRELLAIPKAGAPAVVAFGLSTALVN